MTAAPDRRRHARWPRFGGAILLLAVVAACGPSSPAASPAPGTSAAATPGGVSTDALAAAVLDAALVPFRASSAFTTTVTIDGTVEVTATGRSVGSSSVASVTTGARTVDYVRIPPRAWAREPGGAWVLVAADAAPTAPIDVLSTPTSVEGTGSGPGAVLQATYPAAALGLKGEPVTVTVTLGADEVTFGYQVVTSGRTTISTTSLQPAPADTIAPPG